MLTQAEVARASIHHEVPDASLELEPLDLAFQRSVREAAAQILAGQPCRPEACARLTIAFDLTPR